MSTFIYSGDSPVIEERRVNGHDGFAILVTGTDPACELLFENWPALRDWTLNLVQESIFSMPLKNEAENGNEMVP